MQPPALVKRRFATASRTVEVEYGKGMQEAVEERRRAYQLAEETVKEFQKRGRNPEDAAYILLDVVKNLLGQRWRG
jgi:hypothetical protein